MPRVLAEVAGLMLVKPWLWSLPFVAALLVGVATPTTLIAATAKNSTKSKSSTPSKSPSAPVKPVAIPPSSDPSKGGTSAYSSSPAVLESLGKYLPHALVKLRNREPLHISVIGDEVVGMEGHGDSAGNRLLAWPAQLANELAREFFYAGGVRMLLPGKGKPDKLTALTGPEITMRVLDMDDATLAQAVPAFLALGRTPAPDVIIVAFGAHDAARGGDLMIFAEQLHDLIETMRPKSADLVLVTPPARVEDPPEQSLAMGRPFAGLMRDAAREGNVAFVDLGNLDGVVTVDEDLPREPAEVFASAVSRYRDQFKWPTVRDFRHPLPSLHTKLGRLAFQQLTTAPESNPWAIHALTTAQPNGALQVACELSNPTQGPLRLAVQPLQHRAWTTKEPAIYVDLNPGAKQTLTFTWQRSTDASPPSSPALPANEPFVRLPLFIAGNGTARIEEVRAQPGPLTMLWRLDALFNQQDTFTIENMLVNTTSKDIQAIEWSAEWAGQTKNGKVDVAKGANVSLPLTFNLPSGAGARRIEATLTVSVKLGDQRLNWSRSIEANQNMGLNQNVALVGSGEIRGGAELHCTADKEALTLSVELSGTPHAPLSAELHLDARSYGQRLTQGATDHLRFTTNGDDGTFVAQPVTPWAFGTGYGMHFDENALVGRLSTASNGHRVFAITVPRSYLYLHEWAIGNGNSQLGMQATLTLRGQVAGRDSLFSLTQNGRQPEDAEGMAVLELTDKPTPRWTIVVW